MNKYIAYVEMPQVMLSKPVLFSCQSRGRRLSAVVSPKKFTDLIK